MLVTNEGRVLDYEYFKFPAGEPHIRFKGIEVIDVHSIKINLSIYSPEDLIKLALACDALKRNGAILTELTIGYLASSRQDRVANKGEALSIKVYADVINSLGFKKVNIIDPHSDVSAALIDNSNVVTNHHFVFSKLNQWVGEDYWLVAPDNGASKKIQSLSKFLKHDKVAQGSKVRNTLTGKIKSFDVDVIDFERKDCVIVDDICDGGGTFLGLAKVLKERNAGALFLFITHGIFSKGKEELLEHYHVVESLTTKQ